MPSMNRVFRPLVNFFLILFLSAIGRAADWPQWRGPNRDGVVHGVKAPAKWPKSLQEEWKVDAGAGVASPVTLGANVFLFTGEKKGEDPPSSVENGIEFVLCLDVRTGRQVWRSEPYPVAYKTGLGDRTFPWPRSTATISDGRIYTLGITGILSCLDVKTGKLIWRKECKPCVPYGGNSPLVTDGLCIVHFGDHTQPTAGGGVTAFDAKTGEVKWCCSDSLTPSSCSPIVVDLAGERQIVLMEGFGVLFGISAASGKKLWELRDPNNGYTLSNTPVLFQDMLIFAGWSEPPRAVRLERNDKGIHAKDVWGAQGLPLAFSSPVLAGDLLFGQSTRKRSCLFCLDARTGATLWESDGRLESDAAVLNAGDVWLALTVKGKLLVVKPSRERYQQLAEYQVSDNTTWAHPVFLGERILIKDQNSLRSLAIKADDN